jgi:threonine dehydrogenase-like Zn-dependent dehydrogenase
MIVSVRKKGRCGIIAAYAGFANGFNIGALMEKGVRLIGNGQAPVHKYWEEILGLIKTGKFDPTLCVCLPDVRLTAKYDLYSMITRRVPLEDISKLYPAFDRRQGGVEKVFVETQFSSPPSKGCPTITRVRGQCRMSRGYLYC